MYALFLSSLFHSLDAKECPARRPQPSCVEVVADGLHRLAVLVAREHVDHERSNGIVYNVVLIIVHVIASHLLPVVEGVLRIVGHAAPDALRQLP